MKKFTLILLLAVMLPVWGFGQANVRHSGDTLGVRAHGREVVTITGNGDNRLSINVGGFSLDLEGRENNEEYRNSFTVGGFRLGFIGLTKPDYRMYEADSRMFMELDNGRSLSFSFDVALNLALSKKPDFTSISFGVRPRWNNYVFNQDITLERIGGMVQPLPLDMDRLKKSKLTTFSLDFPVMFGIQPVKGLIFEAGAYVGITPRQFTKVKFPKSKDVGDFGVSFFNAGATMRIKYRIVGIFVDYSFTPLFKSGAGPRTNPFIIGITL